MPHPLTVQNPELEMSCPHPCPLTVQNLELEMSFSHHCPLMTEELELDLSCPLTVHNPDRNCLAPTPVL